MYEYSPSHAQLKRGSFALAHTLTDNTQKLILSPII